MDPNVRSGAINIVVRTSSSDWRRRNSSLGAPVGGGASSDSPSGTEVARGQS
jgi:hypothetical protein